jgi:hypothetical protein
MEIISSNMMGKRGHNMLTIKKLLLVIAGSCTALFIAIFLLRALQVPGINHLEMTVGHAENICESLARYIEEYYSTNEATSLNKVDPIEVVQFLKNNGGRLSSRISSDEPVTSFGSIYDFGVYLDLPDKLWSERAELIAYTTPIRTSGERVYRVVFFLRQSAIFVARLNDQLMVKIIGKESIDRSQPDFYYWHMRAQYLEDCKTGESH